MSRMWVWTIGIVAVVVTLLGIFFFLSQKTPAIPITNNPQNPFGTTGSTPTPIPTKPTLTTPEEGFATNFYTWYLTNIARDNQFPYGNDFNSVLSPWLTPDFIAHWDEYLSAFEVDPVLLTTDDPTPWGKNITTQIVSRSSTGSTVRVIITPGSQAAHAYLVTLVPSLGDHSWRISRVEYSAP